MLTGARLSRTAPQSNFGLVRGYPCAEDSSFEGCRVLCDMSLDTEPAEGRCDEATPWQILPTS